MNKEYGVVLSVGVFDDGVKSNLVRISDNAVVDSNSILATTHWQLKNGKHVSVPFLVFNKNSKEDIKTALRAHVEQLCVAIDEQLDKEQQQQTELAKQDNKIEDAQIVEENKAA